MAANCLLGLLPFCPRALVIAQPHCRRTRIMSLRRATMRNAKVASITHDQSRAKLAAVINAVPRSWSRTYFLWTKERLYSAWPRQSLVCTFQRAIADAARG